MSQSDFESFTLISSKEGEEGGEGESLVDKLKAGKEWIQNKQAGKYIFTYKLYISTNCIFTIIYLRHTN